MMEITWLKKIPDNGIATLDNYSIVLNMYAGSKIIDYYKLKIGVDEKHNIIIYPISRNEVEDKLLDETSLFSYVTSKSFVKISSKVLMNNIENITGIDLITKRKFKTDYNSDKKYLTIFLDKEVK